VRRKEKRGTPRPASALVPKRKGGREESSNHIGGREGGACVVLGKK